MSSGDIVWLIEEQVLGTILSYGSTVSLVKWFKDGIIFEEYLENYEFLEYERLDDEEIQ